MRRGLVITLIVGHFMSTVFFFLGGSLVNWKTKKQSAVSRSSAKAELRLMSLLTADITCRFWRSCFCADYSGASSIAQREA